MGSDLAESVIRDGLGDLGGLVPRVLGFGELVGQFACHGLDRYQDYEGLGHVGQTRPSCHRDQGVVIIS